MLKFEVDDDEKKKNELNGGLISENGGLAQNPLFNNFLF